MAEAAYAAKSIRKSSICLPDSSSAVAFRDRPTFPMVAMDCGTLARPEDSADAPRPRPLAALEILAERYWLPGQAAGDIVLEQLSRQRFFWPTPCRPSHAVSKDSRSSSMQSPCQGMTQ